MSPRSQAERRPEVPSPVTTATQSGVPDFLKDQVSRDAGQGVSTDREDNLVPLIYVLQSNSPQVDSNTQAYLEGAKPGTIWLRNYSSPLVDGAEGILFQPCYFSKDWVEWVLRSAGGGFVGRHEEKPPDAVEKPDPQNPKKMRWLLPNGNEVKETRYHAGYVVTKDGAVPFVIPLSSSGHTVSRNWMFTMMSKRTPDEKIVPSYACLYRLKTRQRSNAQGKWYVLDVTDAGYVTTAEDYARGKSLHDAFVSGEKTAAAEEHVGEDAAAQSDKM